MDETMGFSLVEYLKNDPEKFFNEGKSYQLLQEYFRGFSKDTLRELFYYENRWIRRVAVWITSELGIDGSDLLKEVLTQINDSDIYICSYALEIIANCARGEHIDDFMRVFLFLDHDNQKIRISVMNIISNLSGTRILEACAYLAKKKNFSDSHEKGLSFLLDVNELTYTEIIRMIESADAITRKYGIIVAKKLYDKYPGIVNEAVNNQDLDVREFSKQVVAVKIEFDRFMRTKAPSI